MDQSAPLIATIVVGLVLAFVLGAIADRLRISPLVGYLLAGVAVGAYTPGFIADQALARQLAEIGVILLMFSIGIEFSLRDLLRVKWVATVGGPLGILLSIGLALGVSALLPRSCHASFLSCGWSASRTARGRAAVAILARRLRSSGSQRSSSRPRAAIALR